MPYPLGEMSPRVRWVAIAIWMMATIILLGSGGYSLYENHLFAVEGVQAQGMIEKKFKQTSTGRYGSLISKRYLSYSYTVNGAAYQSAEIPVASSTWYQFDLHNEMPISYLRDDPGDSRIDLPAEVRMSQWFPVVLLFLGVLSLTVLPQILKAGKPIHHVT